MTLSTRYPSHPRYQAVFSPVEGVHGWSAPHYRAELFDHGLGRPGDLGWKSHPVAIAWVTVYPAETVGPMMDYVLVPDHDRREGKSGYAARLLGECERRWPGLRYTDRLAKDGGFRGE